MRSGACAGVCSEMGEACTVSAYPAAPPDTDMTTNPLIRQRRPAALPHGVVETASPTPRTPALTPVLPAGAPASAIRSQSQPPTPQPAALPHGVVETASPTPRTPALTPVLPAAHLPQQYGRRASHRRRSRLRRQHPSDTQAGCLSQDLRRSRRAGQRVGRRSRTAALPRNRAPGDRQETSQRTPPRRLAATNRESTCSAVMPSAWAPALSA